MIVADESRHRWVGVTGLADREQGRAVTEDTLFRTASVAKTFTGALILSLHEEGQLNVDDPLAEHLDIVPNAEAITLRMLLQHTSGIANYTKVPAFRDAVAADPQVVFTYAELVAFAVAQGPDFPPGAAWNYSNTGYILLGMIAENAVGRPLFEEIQARFFIPLRMRDTRPAYVDSLPAALWTSYAERDGELVPLTPGTPYPADGHYVTSLADMVTWSQAFFGGRLHAAETLALAQVTAGGDLLDEVAQQFGLESGGYGLGLVVAEGNIVGTVLAGAGNADGTRTFVGYLPDHHLSLGVAVNVGDGSVPLVESLSAVAPLLQAIRGMPR